MDSSIKDLILGTMLGDSLLLPYENLNKKLAIKRFNKYGYKQSLFLSKGITSDDTDHMFITLQVLLKTNSEKEFKKYLSKKLKLWLLTCPLGIGLTTLKAILKMYLGFSNSGIYSSGNGPLMRVPIIALYYKHDCEKRENFIEVSTILTHKNEDTVLASKAIGNFVAYLANNQQLPNQESLQEILNFKTQNKNWHQYATLLVENINLPQEEFLKKINCEKLVSGYIMHTSIFSIYLMHHSYNMKDSFEKIIQASGDTDTIGALIGTYWSLLNSKEIDDSLLNIIPAIDTNQSIEKIANQYFWSKLIIKNLISLPILSIHALLRIFQLNLWR